MYPTMVIFLVETQRSMQDICEICTLSLNKIAGPVASEARPAASGRLSFVVGQVHSTTVMGGEPESQLSHSLQRQGGQEHGLEVVILEVKEGQVGASS